MTERRGAERILCEGKPSVAAESWTGVWYCARCGEAVRKPVRVGGNTE